MKGGRLDYSRGKDRVQGSCRQQKRKVKALCGARTFCYSTDKVYDPKLVTCSETSSHSVFFRLF